MDFQGKIVVVTGAAQGLGAAISRRFLEDGAAGVAMLDLKDEVVKAAAGAMDPSGARALAISCNVADPDSVREAFRQVYERFGRVDVLVNNAGITRDAMAHKMTAEQFDAVLKVSLYGAFYCVQQVICQMREQKSGRIISMSSLAHRGNIGQANYSAAKAGIIGLTKTLAMELGPKNITVNCIAPCIAKTDIVKTMPEKVYNDMVNMIPLRRAGEPEEIASLVAYLASDEAAYISGQCINISGGWW